MSGASLGQPAALDLWSCGYRIKCTASGCGNLARIIVRRVTDGGAPDGQSELCNEDAREAVAAAEARGFRCMICADEGKP